MDNKSNPGNGNSNSFEGGTSRNYIPKPGEYRPVERPVEGYKSLIGDDKSQNEQNQGVVPLQENSGAPKTRREIQDEKKNQESFLKRNKSKFIVLGALALGGLGAWWGGVFPNNSGTQNSKLSPEQQAIAKSLDVTSSSPEGQCGTLLGNQMEKGNNGQEYVPFDIGALKPVNYGNPEDRQISTGMESPIIPNNPNQALGQVMRTVCEDPEFGLALSNLFYLTTIGQNGPSIGQVNSSWMENSSNIAENAAKFIPELNQNIITQEQLQKAEKANIAWQEYAAKLNTILLKFQNMGIQANLVSTVNYHVEDGGVKISGLPEEAISPNQDSKPALVLELTGKNISCYAVIGFNTEDQRPELFACPTGQSAQKAQLTITSSPSGLPKITTTFPYNTTIIGPKQNPSQPVGSNNSPTTVGSNEAGPSTPTEEIPTTAPANQNQGTVSANNSASTTTPAGGDTNKLP